MVGSATFAIASGRFATAATMMSVPSTAFALAGTVPASVVASAPAGMLVAVRAMVVSFSVSSRIVIVGRADRNDTPVLEHNDWIPMLESRAPVRNNQRGALPHKRCEGLHHLLLGQRVEVCRRLVEDQDRRIL